jgi:hypothetical protein
MNALIAHMGAPHIHPEHAAIAMLLIFALGLLALATQRGSK